MRRLVTCAVLGCVLALETAGAAGQDMYVYPSANQSEQQLERDKEQCHQWAVQQTGVDPEKMAATPPGAGQGGGSGAAGAGLGAARGAAQGEAASGAMRGFGMAGLIRTVRARRQMEQQHDAYMQDHQARQTQLQSYDRAYGACLTGRGYTVR